MLIRTATLASVVSMALVPAHAADPNLRAQAQAIFKPLSGHLSSGDSSATIARVELGRLLFFDTRVSADGTVSCARCHQPTLYGTDGLPTSIGAAHRVNPRNAPTVLNAAVQFVQHW